MHRSHFRRRRSGSEGTMTARGASGSTALTCRTSSTRASSKSGWNGPVTILSIRRQVQVEAKVQQTLLNLSINLNLLYYPVSGPIFSPLQSWHAQSPSTQDMGSPQKGQSGGGPVWSGVNGGNSSWNSSSLIRGSCLGSSAVSGLASGRGRRKRFFGTLAAGHADEGQTAIDDRRGDGPDRMPLGQLLSVRRIDIHFPIAEAVLHPQFLEQTLGRGTGAAGGGIEQGDVRHVDAPSQLNGRMLPSPGENSQGRHKAETGRRSPSAFRYCDAVAVGPPSDPEPAKGGAASAWSDGNSGCQMYSGKSIGWYLGGRGIGKVRTS